MKLIEKNENLVSTMKMVIHMTFYKIQKKNVRFVNQKAYIDLLKIQVKQYETN